MKCAVAWVQGLDSVQFTMPFPKPAHEQANLHEAGRACIDAWLMGRLTCANCAVQAIDSSCRSLGVEALDLVQFYWHDYSAPKYVGAAQRLADLQAAGRIRHMGVTNFDVPRLDEIVQGGVRVVSNQARAPHGHPHMQRRSQGTA